MSSGINYQTDVPQLVSYQVQGFLHGISKHKRWSKHHDKPSRIIANPYLCEDDSVHTEQINDLDFQKQLDKIALWFEKWSHSQRCFVLERLVLIGDHSQFQLLWTAIQPVLHKDFLYTAKERFPSNQFNPVSTDHSRAERERLTKNRLIHKYHRAKSVYLQDEKGVKSLISLPTKNYKEFTIASKDSYIRLPALHRRSSITKPTDHLVINRDEPTANWRRAMQVRRHLQANVEEENPRSSFSPHSNELFQWYSAWEGSKRAMFLQLALMKLDARQLYFLSAFLSVRRHRDILAHLPEHLAHLILSFLSPLDLSNCSKVSTVWHSLCQHNVIWKKKCNETKLDLRPVNTPKVGGWKGAYKKDRLLKLNWKLGNCSKVRLTGHADSVLCLAINNKIIVSGGKDSTVRVWNLSSGRLLHVFTGHQKGVWAVAVISDHLVASGSFDRTVKIWGLGNNKTRCFRTFYGHYGPVWTMVCKSIYLASGSQDRLIKVWDVRHCTLHQTLKGHTSAVFSIDSDENMNKLFSGSADKSIRIWNISTGTCLRVLWTGEPTSVMAISYSHGYLASTSGGHVTLWDSVKGVKVRCFRAHKQRIETIRLNIDDESATSGIVMTGGKDGRLKYWNVFGERANVVKLDEHSGQINALCADSLRIVTASYDQSIVIWDFREKRSSSRISLHSRAFE